MNSSVLSNGERPWENLSNPFNFPTLAAAAKNVYLYPSALLAGNPNYAPHSKKPAAPQRSVAVGRDWMGVGFQQGDPVLASNGSTMSVFEVDEIFLDDSNGKPYLLEPSTGWLVRHKTTGEILYSGYQGQALELRRIDPTWIGTHLGLVTTGEKFYWLGDDYERISFQSFRVRVKPVGPDAGSKKRNFTQEQVTVLNQHQDLATIELLLKARRIPLLGKIDK